jgi:hypothetical protein
MGGENEEKDAAGACAPNLKYRSGTLAQPQQNRGDVAQRQT